MPGGQIATAMATCARLGWRTRYIGSFGDDDFGTLSRESLIARAWTSAPRARSPARPTSSRWCWSMRAPASARCSGIAIPTLTMQRRGRAAGRGDLRPHADRRLPRNRRGDAGRDDTRARRACRRSSTSRRCGPASRDLLQHIDAIIAAAGFPDRADRLRGSGPRARGDGARVRRARSSCVTLGAEGSLAWCGGRQIRTPAFQVDCVDSTGAGDVFRGAFAAGVPARPGRRTSRMCWRTPTPPRR